jgi:hypothetical protein
MQTLEQKQRAMRQRERRARHNRKFTIRQEEAMRELKSAGWTLKAIADVFGLTDAGVYYIVNRSA